MKKITIPELREMKTAKQKIVTLTAYDFPFALLLDEAGVEIILVGDSLGNVVLGYDSTVPVTMSEMIHHTKPVARAVKHALVVADMPFLSYQVNCEDAVFNAGRLVKEAGADAVKIEGAGKKVLRAIKNIIEAGIPVMGHLGLTPQTATILGGLKVQGRTAEAAEKIFAQAQELEKAGCFAVVLECVPDELAAMITKKIRIPVIGIGAGPECDGQVLVLHDLLGLYSRPSPKFVKKYADLGKAVSRAVGAFSRDVRQGDFPAPEHVFSLDPKIARTLKKSVVGKS